MKALVIDEKDDFIFIREAAVVRRVRLEQIHYAEAMGDYVKLYTSGKFYAVHTTLKAVEDRLPSTRFFRVHRSYLVALDKIDLIQEGVLIVSGKPVPVADAYRARLNDRINVL
jgi:DNA-binding LytR/AlgR family response regulator